MDSKQCRRLVIREVSGNVSTGNGIRSWKVDLVLDGVAFRQNVVLIDPFSVEDEAECRWYLERYATDSPFERSRAYHMTDGLQLYGTRLIEQLSLKDCLTSGQNQDSMPETVLRIEVVDQMDSQEVSMSTIHMIHWELLENTKLWPKLLSRVVVGRKVTQAALTLPKRVQSWPLDGTNTFSFNILVVLARNLSTNPSGYEDLDPYTALGALLAVQRALSTGKTGWHLNIEVVRPGTFQAFRAHLDKVRAARGPGYFHAVHFDLHGRTGVRKPDGQNVAWLLFQSERDSSKTVPVSGTKVAELLHKHLVNIAVLNACDSARANKGLDANLARCLSQRGVSNVLAMSYKFISSAATLFVCAFYQELFIRSKPFSDAAWAARSLLQRIPKRDARFSLKVDVHDWFVPVTYTSDEYVQLLPVTESHSKGISGDTEMSEKVPHVQIDWSAIGRDYDILRFEQLVIKNKTVYLYGVSGIGKTVMVKQLFQVWKSTSFVKQFISIDLYVGYQTMSNLLQDIVHQLPIPAEGLHDPFRAECLENGLSKPIYLILVGREYDTWWKSSFGSLNATRFQLPPLNLASSLFYAESVLRANGVDGDWFQGKQSDWMVHLINLLQRNLLAVHLILLHFSRSGLPMEVYFEMLLKGELDLSSALTKKELVGTASTTAIHLMLNFPERLDEGDLICSLGPFWNQGPSHMDTFIDSLKRYSVVQNNYEHQQWSLGIFLEIGAFSKDDVGIAWMHPLFTIFLRKKTQERLKSKHRSRGWVEGIVRSFLEDVDHRFRLKGLSPFEDLTQDTQLILTEEMKPSIFNHLWALDACSNHDLKLELNDWPLSLMFFFESVSKLPYTERNLSRAFVTRAFEAFCDRYRSCPLPQVYSYFSLSLADAALATCNTLMYKPQEHSRKILEEAIAIITRHEKRYGAIDKPRYQALQYIFYVGAAIYRLEYGPRDEANKLWIKSCKTLKVIASSNIQPVECFLDYLLEEMSPTRIHFSKTKEGVGLRLRADEDFYSINPSQLPFRKGDIITVLEPVDSNWWSGILRGCIGHIPLCKVEMLSEATEDELQMNFEDVIMATKALIPQVRATSAFKPSEPGELKFRKGDLIDLLVPVDKTRWKGWLDGRTGVIPLSCTEVLSHKKQDGEILKNWPMHRLGGLGQLTWISMKTFMGRLLRRQNLKLTGNDLDSGFAWSWIQRQSQRQLRERQTFTSPTLTIPLPALRKHLAASYSVLYTSYKRNELRGIGIDSIKQATLADNHFVNLLRQRHLAAANVSPITHLSSLERAQNVGEWYDVAQRHQILADLAYKTGDSTQWIYHNTRLQALYEGAEGEEGELQMRLFKIREMMARVEACRDYVLRKSVTVVGPEQLIGWLKGLTEGDRWMEEREKRENEDADAQVEMYEKWLEKYGTAAEFDMGIDMA
ncbi:hypothetical protein V502_06759 [Pseudogymnoascus sp. VKM F-4520 (FW-2644)]|nr:hypothetical protein V502_06759 [Pseudogymnoascus sp. VKM F-4520 (FW-2644)]